MKTKMMMMLALLLATPALAETLTISDRDPNEARAQIPSTLVETILNSGFEFQALNNGVYSLSLKDIHCETGFGGALDPSNPNANLRRTACRVNSENEQHTKKGDLFKEALNLDTLFGQLELGDCGSGYCSSFVNSLNCTVDTKVEQSRGAGRFACTLDYEY